MKKISFVINSSNDTLDHLKVLVKSLKQNLHSKDHEILIFVDSDNEGSADWLRTQKKHFNDLKIITHKLKPCVGYSRNNNLLVELAKNDIVSYLQSDMVIGPDYDVNILSDLKDNCILSATRIEPPLHGESEYTITRDFGTDPTKFDIQQWNEYSKSVVAPKTAEYFFAPITFYKNVWLKLGGYDTIFRRSREDSDFVQRCLQTGVELIQTWNANVYHFTCVTSRGKNWFDASNDTAQKRNQIQLEADIIELRRFVRKWGGFNHGTKKLDKYDIDLVINDSNVDEKIPIGLEPLVSRVWITADSVKNKILSLISTEHEPANVLLNFSNTDWESAKKYYNLVDYDAIYKVGHPTEFNIKIELNTKHLIKNDLFMQYANQLHDIVKAYQPGIYELGSAVIHINKLQKTTENNIYVKNPEFDYSLLEIE